jgi:hypothetical protein
MGNNDIPGLAIDLDISRAYDTVRSTSYGFVNHEILDQMIKFLVIDR